MGEIVALVVVFLDCAIYESAFRLMATDFLLLVQEKVSKEKDTVRSRHIGNTLVQVHR